MRLVHFVRTEIQRRPRVKWCVGRTLRLLLRIWPPLLTLRADLPLNRSLASVVPKSEFPPAWV